MQFEKTMIFGIILRILCRNDEVRAKGAEFFVICFVGHKNAVRPHLFGGGKGIGPFTPGYSLSQWRIQKKKFFWEGWALSCSSVEIFLVEAKQNSDVLTCTEGAKSCKMTS